MFFMASALIQISEICGILHSSMPIVIQSVSLEKFIAWLAQQQ